MKRGWKTQQERERERERKSEPVWRVVLVRGYRKRRKESRGWTCDEAVSSRKTLTADSAPHPSPYHRFLPSHFSSADTVKTHKSFSFFDFEFWMERRANPVPGFQCTGFFRSRCNGLGLVHFSNLEAHVVFFYIFGLQKLSNLGSGLTPFIKIPLQGSMSNRWCFIIFHFLHSSFNHDNLLDIEPTMEYG